MDILQVISDMLDKKLEAAFALNDEKLDKKLEAAFALNDEKLDKKLEAAFALNDEKLEKKLDTALTPIRNDIRDIKLTLENEITRNINIIAEGHAILNRRLDEALKVESEKELLLIRVNRIENELRQMREQQNGIA